MSRSELSYSFSVVIPTHNRAHLLSRAVESVFAQGVRDVEVIVVDDGSTDSTPMVVRKDWPSVRYLRQEVSQGPGVARNLGLSEARNPWIIMLDDDDALRGGALRMIAEQMASLPGLENYPVLKFAHDNGSLEDPFRLVTVEDYLSGAIRGDFVPVINARRFLAEGFRYPSIRTGAEHLLWWDVAARFRIPTWSTKVAQLGTDAPNRLTSAQQQIARAEDHAHTQELTLQIFGELLLEKAPQVYYQRRMGAFTYWLLAGERKRARQHLQIDWRGRYRLMAPCLWFVSFLPRNLVVRLFTLYRTYGSR